MKEKFEIITRGTAEVVTEAELHETLRREKFTAYCGYEPSGKIHFGHALTVQKLMDLQKVGARVIVLLADLHAYPLWQTEGIPTPSFLPLTGRGTMLFEIVPMPSSLF